MATFSVTVILLLVLTIPVCMGIYVWRDASRRGMNAPAWTMLVILGPMFIGLLIYLLVRANHSDLRCSGCGTRVRRDFAVCPGCGAKLRPACPTCHYPVEPDWAVCPHCAQPLPGQYPDVTPPAQRPDRGLLRLLVLIILLPLLAIGLIAVFSFSSFNASLSTITCSMEEYLARDDRIEAVAWLEDCIADGSREAYALRYDEKSGDDCATTYLIYVPHAGALRVDCERKATLFGARIVASFTQNTGISMVDDGGGQRLVFVTCYSDRFCDLEVLLGGMELDCEVTDAVRNPALFAVHGEEYAIP